MGNVHQRLYYINSNIYSDNDQNPETTITNLLSICQTQKETPTVHSKLSQHWTAYHYSYQMYNFPIAHPWPTTWIRQNKHLLSKTLAHITITVQAWVHATEETGCSAHPIKLFSTSPVAEWIYYKRRSKQTQKLQFSIGLKLLVTFMTREGYGWKAMWNEGDSATNILFHIIIIISHY